MDKISDYLSTGDLLCQLAEECSELAQAALKLKRAMEGTNPPQRSILECWDDLDEEIADVFLVIQQMGLTDREHTEKFVAIAEKKKERWLHWLQKNHRELMNRIRECKEFEKEVAETKRAVQEIMFLKAELDMFSDWQEKAPQIREMCEAYSKVNQELMGENQRLRAEKENRGIWAKIFGAHADESLHQEERGDENASV